MISGQGGGTERAKTIERVVNAAVSIRYYNPCGPDAEPVGIVEATGFIVDAMRRYVLTNRHVIGPGPFCGHVISYNHEEAQAYPIYHDSVHDFDFLRFDPTAIKKISVEAVELKVDLAKVGVEFRVIGNDGGDRMCLLLVLSPYCTAMRPSTDKGTMIST